MASRLDQIVLIASRLSHVRVRDGGDNRLIFERQRGHWFSHVGHAGDVREIHPRLRRNLSRSSSARLRPVTSIAVRWLTPVSRFGFRIQSGQRRLCYVDLSLSF
jgi:hypothetical protein